VVERARAAAQVAAHHAARHDRDGTFPVEGLAELARNGYIALALLRRWPRITPHAMIAMGRSQLKVSPS